MFRFVVSLQFEKAFDVWLPTLTTNGHVIISHSYQQRKAVQEVLSPVNKKDSIQSVWDLNWEKIQRYTGYLCVNESGPRFASNGECLTQIFIGPGGDHGTGVDHHQYHEYFPFWASKNIPQGVKDELRSVSFRVAFESKGLQIEDVDGKGRRGRANIFEKGMALGEFLVSFS